MVIKTHDLLAEIRRLQIANAKKDALISIVRQIVYSGPDSDTECMDQIGVMIEEFEYDQG